MFVNVYFYIYRYIKYNINNNRQVLIVIYDINLIVSFKMKEWVQFFVSPLAVDRAKARSSITQSFLQASHSPVQRTIDNPLSILRYIYRKD